MMICEHIAEKMNLLAKQNILETALLKKRKSSQDKYWIPTYKDETKLPSGNLQLQGIVQKPTVSNCFSQNRLLAMPTSYKSMSEKFFHSSEITPFCSQ
jgi:hypothetical protein